MGTKNANGKMQGNLALWPLVKAIFGWVFFWIWTRSDLYTRMKSGKFSPVTARFTNPIIPRSFLPVALSVLIFMAVLIGFANRICGMFQFGRRDSSLSSRDYSHGSRNSSQAKRKIAGPYSAGRADGGARAGSENQEVTG